jgi:hypothetical protein
MSTTETNNKPRKSLADQIDRLDSLLTGLSEAIEGTVAEAVRRSVTVAIERAVEGLFTQLVANPAVVELLRGATAPTSPEGPPATSAASPVRQRLAGLAGRAKTFGLKVSSVTAGFGRRVLAALRPRLLPLAAVAIGVAGALCCAAGWPLVAAGWAAGMAGRLASWCGPGLGLVPARGTRGSN